MRQSADLVRQGTGSASAIYSAVDRSRTDIEGSASFPNFSPQPPLLPVDITFRMACDDLNSLADALPVH